MIAETEVEKAVEFLRTNAQEAAQARANVKYLAEFVKSKKAQIAFALLTVQKSAAAAELAAASDPQYIDTLEAYKFAVEQDAFHTFKREAADALIRAWQTQQSTLRAEGRAYG